MLFRQRSYQKELIDNMHVPLEDVKRNMYELDVINRYLGGHKITVKGVSNIITSTVTFEKPLNIVEIGCGGGDNLRAIRNWAERVKLKVELVGVDINPNCIEYARTRKRNRGIKFYCSDYRELQLRKKPQIIFSSLFVHHFSDDEIVKMLTWLHNNSSLGFFINDLHRHPVAYYSIKLLTSILSRSYLVKNDAPLSVKRGFRKRDWKELFDKVNITEYECKWQWAFRWLVIVTKHANSKT